MIDSKTFAGKVTHLNPYRAGTKSNLITYSNHATESRCIPRHNLAVGLSFKNKQHVRYFCSKVQTKF